MLAAPTYTRESRRFENFPGRRKQVGLEALAAIDTSGSMSDEDLAIILGQLLQIKKVSGTKIWIVWGDTKQAGGPIPIEKLRQKINFTGRGGTDLCWPFELADKMRLPLVVYFTDGYGPAPVAVNQRVLWVLTKDSNLPWVSDNYSSKVTYGEVVRME